MNQCQLVGRLTKDPVVSINPNNQNKVARFSLAVTRSKTDTDYINIVAFGKTAELAEQWLKKGKAVAVLGSIKTGSYEKDGKKVYTTDVWANSLEFLPTGGEKKEEEKEEKEETIPGFENFVPEGFAKIDTEEIPF